MVKAHNGPFSNLCTPGPWPPVPVPLPLPSVHILPLLQGSHNSELTGASSGAKLRPPTCHTTTYMRVETDLDSWGLGETRGSHGAGALCRPLKSEEGPLGRPSSTVPAEQEGSRDTQLDFWMCLYLEERAGWLRFILGFRPKVTGWGLGVQDRGASPGGVCVGG